LVTTAGLLLAFSFRAQVFDGLWAYIADPSSHVVMNRLSQDAVLSVWAGLGAATAATSTLGFCKLALPRWLGWLGAVVTLFIIGLVLAGLPFPANIPTGIWLLTLSIWAIRNSKVKSLQMDVG
jgi:hypothetical protein